MKSFCVRHYNGRLPNPLLIWIALSHWGNVLDMSTCANVIELSNTTHFGQTDTVVDSFQRIVHARIVINTQAIKTNGLFYNVLLHELGHANGLHHPAIDDGSIMSYKVLIAGNDVIQNVRFFTNPNVFIPFSPFAVLTYRGIFYETN